VLGRPKSTSINDLTSVFVYRNAWAAYAGLGLLAAMALLGRAASGSVSMGLTNRAGITHFVDSMEPLVFVIATGILTLATALLLSHSRAGLAITAAGGLTMLAALAVGQRGRRRQIGVVVVVLVVLGLGLVELGGGQTLGRVMELSEQGTGRKEIHEFTWRAIHNAPVTGYGLDTFPQVFYLYRDDSLPWRTPRFDRPHGAYLELAAEGGIVGFAGIMGAFGYIAAVLVAGLFRRRRNLIFPAVGLGAGALVGVHAFYDFSIQIPAITVTCLTMMGIGFAQSWPTRASAGEDAEDGQ
jgi:O-antigen ligase